MADGATLESQIEELLDQETFEPPKAFADAERAGGLGWRR